MMRTQIKARRRDVNARNEYHRSASFVVRKGVFVKSDFMAFDERTRAIEYGSQSHALGIWQM